MSLGALLPGPVRRTVARRIDPWAVRRTDALLRRRATALPGDRYPAIGAVDPGGADGPGVPARPRPTDVALTALRDRVLTRARNAVLEGLVPLDDPELTQVIAAQLTRLQANAVPDGLVEPITAAFAALWQPDAEPVPPPAPAVERAISDQFHRLWYHTSDRTWKHTTYRGHGTYKCPTDMWIYAELVYRLAPAMVIETGTHRGGSALFLADCLERIGHGRVVSIDINDTLARPDHPRITYLTGSSTDPHLLDQLRAELPADGHVLVVLDSDHRRDHVSAELTAYAPMVSVGSYLIVEDTNVNGHPAWPSWGPGPFEAAQAFLAGNKDFTIDRACEQYYLTMNPGGFLRRVR